MSRKNTCNKPIQENLRYNVSGRLAKNYLPQGALPFESLPQAVCCDSFFFMDAEPANFYARPDVDLFKYMVENNGTTTFYDSVCGEPIFRGNPGINGFFMTTFLSTSHHWEWIYILLGG